MKSSLMNWKRLKLREIRNPDIEASINNECKKAVCCMVDGLYYVTGTIASLLIDVFEDNSIECERQGRYDKIICKLRKQKKKEYI